MIEDLMRAAGIVPHQPAAEQAAAVIRRFALRVRADGGGRDLRSIFESRCFAGPKECLRVLAEIYRGTPARGTAFGLPWPYLEAGGYLLAPALPVALGSDEADGPDASYGLRDRVVWREAIGETRPFLFTEAEPAATDSGVELLWFGDSERAAVRDGMLEVEDLFSVFRLPASMLLLERYLLRPRRVDRAAVEGLELDRPQAPAEIEVRRPRELMPGDAWRDAAALLRARADIRGVEAGHEQLVADTRHGERVVFNLVAEPGGWRLYTWEGEYSFQTMSLIEVGGVLHFSATLASHIDPLTHGLRGRLAFDLRSDLLTLEADQSS
jgi:hypothetical protein